jgi:hypothetical protein
LQGKVFLASAIPEHCSLCVRTRPQLLHPHSREVGRADASNERRNTLRAALRAAAPSHGAR